jgi:hypothetical protein
MATETLKYLLNPCWLTELGAARWFERTLVCCARGWLRPKRQWCTGLHSEAWAKIQSTHCNATPGRIRILQRTTFSLYWNRPRSSHSISRAYHCKMWEKGGGMSCRGFSAFARMTVGMMMVVFGNTSRSIYHQFNSRCLLGVNCPPPRHRDGTYTPVEYALHSWFIPSQTANVATCFSGLGTDGKPWTMRTQSERRHSEAVCKLSTRRTTSHRPPFRKFMVWDGSLDLFYESAG